MKVLSWNIQNFVLRRIFDPSGATQDERDDNSDRALANAMYIVRTVREADPDVFIVLEPRCAQSDDLGTLAAGEGVLGLLLVLRLLRLISPQWMLVPPLLVNPRAYEDGLPMTTRSETVGVFWRDDNVQFTGPWIWPAAASATGPPVAAGVGAANYPNYDGVIVPANTQAAPRYTWNTLAGPAYTFPDARHRRPLLTSFTERNAPARNVNILCFHPSPGVAREALLQLAKVLAQYCQPAGGALTLAVGDMNVDLLNLDILGGDLMYHFERTTWINPAYRRVAPNPVAPTMLRRASGGRADQRAIPTRYTKNECLDYGWVLYGGGTAVAPNGPAAKVVDRVAGSPAVAPFPLFSTEMLSTLANFAGMGNVDLRNTVFRQRWNYGHIAPPNDGTSDHLPVLVVV